MFNYTELTTAELLDLLFQEEDRVTEAHLREVARRQDETAPRLQEILLNEDYWYEGQHGEYWIELHVITALAAMRYEPALPDLIAMIEHAYFAEQEWTFEQWPPVLAAFGPAAVAPLIEHINKLRGAHHDNPDYAHVRDRCANALTRIALKHESVRAQVRDFLCGLFTNPQEDDRLFLSFSADYPYAIDRERGLQVIKAAYARGAIEEKICGDYRAFLKWLRDPQNAQPYELHSGLFDCYQPRRIAERHKKWEEDKEKAQLLYWEPQAPPGAPAGYEKSEAGALVRTEKVGRNDPCPCGSGKKYKRCCGA
jgi:hypothetical protein